MMNSFQKDVLDGLGSMPKFLSSKYFYDDIGDDIFVEIMHMPEYYLTDAEMEIFREQKDHLAKILSHPGSFQVFELGAGDGTKTFHLLKELSAYDFTYRPIDISAHAIDMLTLDLAKRLPSIEVSGIVSDYFKVLPQIKESNRPKSILFLGSNIGNMKDDMASDFMAQLSRSMNPGDKLLIGADLKKSKDIVLPAYNDAQGITARFNLNLLNRINKELDANFDLETFQHAPEYDEETGVARSFLRSKKDQTITIGALQRSFEFEEGEKIHTETSRKYDEDLIVTITKPHNLRLLEQVKDRRGYFADFIFEKHN